MTIQEINSQSNEVLFEEILDGLVPIDNELPFYRPIGEGSTGVTFLPKSYDFGWVIKWQKPSLTEAEHLCTEFYRRSFKRLSVPKTICSLPDELRKKIDYVFREEAIGDGCLPMLIEYKKGPTLGRHFEHRRFAKLPFHEKKRILASIGEVAGYDFLIANFDRFIPRDINLSNPNASLSELAFPRVNGGNLMVELIVPPISQSKKDKKSVQFIHVIDTAPDQSSFFSPLETKNSTDSKEIELGAFWTFCGSEEAEEETATLLVEVESSINMSYKDGRCLRDACFQNFRGFMSGDINTINRLAAVIHLGIQNESKECMSKRAGEIPSWGTPEETMQLEQALAGGLFLAQSEMLRLPLEETLEEIKELPTSTEAGKIVLEFITRNIELTQALSQREPMAVRDCPSFGEAVLQYIDEYMLERGASESESSVKTDNPHRVFLESLRNDLYHYDEEKGERILYNLKRYLNQHPQTDPELAEVLGRVATIITHFQKTGEVQISPVKPLSSPRDPDPESKARRRLFEGEVED